jgi:PAS domain S-box-containing protein
MTQPGRALHAILEETAEDLYEHAPCGYLSLLDDGTIAKVNATFLEWTGYERADLVGGRRFRDLLSVGGRIYYETHFQPLLRMQGGVREIAFEITRKDGNRLAVLVNARHRDQAPAGGITRITVFDATDRRRYERELLAARHRAEDIAQAQQNLLATISHDVRAPLSAITTAIALLETSPLTPEQAACLRVLRSSSAHALELVTNALDLARLDAGRTPLRERPFDVRAFVEELAATARAAAIGKPELDITTRVDDAVPDSLVGDRPKIGQVITNLLMNAVKFTARGFVTLVVSQREATRDAVTLDVVVSDSGIGIASDRLAHIFDEYAQASDDIADRYGGSGLGLAIARRLLQLYGSTLQVASTVGQGTAFSFVLTLSRTEGAASPVGTPTPVLD